MYRSQIPPPFAAALVALFTASSAPGTLRAEGPAPPPCAMRLLVEITPDVPNPGDPGFLASLLGDHPGHYLTLRRVIDDTHLDLQLYGPGPTERCQAVVDSMRSDGRVIAIDVQ
jgi:hypothetical protein